jgi:hypothetical protein
MRILIIRFAYGHEATPIEPRRGSIFFDIQAAFRLIPRFDDGCTDLG